MSEIVYFCIRAFSKRAAGDPSFVHPHVARHDVDHRGFVQICWWDLF